MKCRIVGLGVSAIVALAVVTVLHAADLAGTWIGTTEVPDTGTDEVTLVLAKANGGYTGTLTDTLGKVAKEPIREVRATADTLAFQFSLTDGAVLTMKLKLTGDRLAGQWDHPDGSVGAIAFVKRK